MTSTTEKPSKAIAKRLQPRTRVLHCVALSVQCAFIAFGIFLLSVLAIGYLTRVPLLLLPLLLVFPTDPFIFGALMIFQSARDKLV